jgi:hypothetical protein
LSTNELEKISKNKKSDEENKFGHHMLPGGRERSLFNFLL